MADKDPFFDKETSSIVNFTKKFWLKEKNKTFLFTGCTGFFGIWLLNVFLKANLKFKLNLKIIVLTRNKKIRETIFYKKLKYKKKIIFLIGDIRSFQFPKKILKIHYIIHGATTSALETFNNQDYNLKYSIIVKGTKRIIKLAKKTNCENFYYLSSGAVYGYHKKKIKLRENLSFLSNKKISKKENDITILGKAKKNAEELIIKSFINSKTYFFIGRFFTFVGPFMPLKIHYAIGNFLLKKIDNKSIHLNSNGQSLRSYMYIKDCIIWIIISLFKNDMKNRGIYNLGSDKKISIFNLAKKISKIGLKRSKVFINDEITKHNYYIPDISKFKKVFNPPNITNLDLAIQKTMRHIRKNKKLYE